MNENKEKVWKFWNDFISSQVRETWDIIIIRDRKRGIFLGCILCRMSRFTIYSCFFCYIYMVINQIKPHVSYRVGFLFILKIIKSRKIYSNLTRLIKS